VLLYKKHVDVKKLGNKQIYEKNKLETNECFQVIKGNALEYLYAT
jgi:hypothetical protein